MFLVSSCSCLCPIQWSQVLSQEWRCRWSSAGRRCSNYMLVIDNFIAYWGVSYIRDFTVFHTGLQLLRHHLNQINSLKTSRSLPLRLSYGVSFVRIFEKINCIIMAPHCISISHQTSLALHGLITSSLCPLFLRTMTFVIPPRLYHKLT